MKRINFNDNWNFSRQGSGGRHTVTLPHDAQILERRSADASNGGHGYFPGGVYTYEKTFTAPADWAGKTVLMEFEGVYRNCAVSLNGVAVGGHQYGYTTSAVELTGLNYGGKIRLPLLPITPGCLIPAGIQERESTVRCGCMWGNRPILHIRV